MSERPPVHVSVGDLTIDDVSLSDDQLLDAVMAQLGRSGGRLASDRVLARQVAASIVARVRGTS